MDGLAPQVAAQVGRQFAGCRITPDRLLGQGFQANRFQIAWDPVVEAARGPWRLMDHLMQEHGPRAAKRQFAAKQLVKDDAQAVDVAAAVRPVASARRLFGAHVCRRAEELAINRKDCLGLLPKGQPEIDNQSLCRRCAVVVPGAPARSEYWRA